MYIHEFNHSANMPHPCVVCGRSRMNPNNREEEYMFFGFPVNDEARCRKWLEFCCREDLYKLTKKQLLQRMVCSKHFEQRDFLNEYFDRLNCTAVPSIYDPKQSLYNITCVLCGRFRRDPPNLDYDGATFHHFPGEEFRCLKWLDFVGVDSYYRLTRKEILFCYICSKHFDRSQFMRGYRSRLVDTAVPNIRFPDQLDETEPFIMELVPEPKLFTTLEKGRKLEPLPLAVLESQACAACGRSRSDPRNKVERYKFHPFPAYEIGRCLRWCQFLGREDLLKMSPNQIRKLVLCSKHFQTGQRFHKEGPCDAVPTIKDVSELEPCDATEQVEAEQETIEESASPGSMRPGKKQMLTRPLVSSKKPKMDNKPAPLAKKRGKSRRPTSIIVPRPDPNNIENRVVRKLPLPPAANWKLISNQFQPITLSNNITSNISSNITADGKKVILPFTGNISNLGAPIPVHSLSSIPPGLLIKINLPDQKNTQLGKGQNHHTRRENLSHAGVEGTGMKNGQVISEASQGKTIVRSPEQDLSELLSFSPDSNAGEDNSEDANVQGEVILPHSLEIMEDDSMHIKKERFYEESLEDEKPPLKRSRRRSRMTGRTRRTIMPIRSELKYFLQKIKPQMHKLPRKARAQLKLSIVNMVIDKL
ncbi:uncharacterized protein LOC105700336 [Orussus abietinus]|uniref:uncharacterized protein LOC105700336 n=1 Tax=Orussus abietinus TaxID=222816 RepID=UPI00062560E5|nr:uncharacterized protein LOC105700336 [Orussus abietinus]